MMKKLIPVIFGALLLGTNVEAILITCPTEVDTSSMIKGGYIIEGGIRFVLNPVKQTNQILNFANKSVVTSWGRFEHAYCYYRNAAGDQYTLSFLTNRICTVPGVSGRQCEGPPGGSVCAKVTCR